MNRTHALFALSIALGSLSTLAPTSVFALDYGQKVEFFGSCAQTTLAQVCQTPNITSPGFPTSVSCDDSSGPAGVACGVGGAKCARLTLSGNQLLSTYCQDGSGADAVVSCRQQ
jgi:hypothetical protein